MDDTFRIKGFIPTSFLDWPGQLCSVIFLVGADSDAGMPQSQTRLGAGIAA
jgi:hypothetical protein